MISSMSGQLQICAGGGGGYLLSRKKNISKKHAAHILLFLISVP